MVKTIRVHDVIYEIKGENYELAEKLDISDGLLRGRLLKGWSLAEACQVPKGIDPKDLVYINYAKQHQADNTKAKINYREEKRKSKRPWLYDGTPQQHSRGNWCQYLMNTSIFPKVVH
ncbi:SA1788 family PVL leukocidin-associated protein [Staphylococcus ureilyticus]|uniref:SA1788 family PVL leukocidin-associated protein n=1 Tax=Staphylococcus ureilyticus TaxID=94138 RepID=UPI0034DCD5F4